MSTDDHPGPGSVQRIVCEHGVPGSDEAQRLELRGRGRRVDDHTTPAARDPSGSERAGSVATMTGVSAILVATNVVVSAVVSSWAYIATILTASALAVFIARKSGATLDDLGLAVRHARRSLLVGLGIGGVIAVAVFAAAAVPGVRGVFVDDRFADLGAGALAFQALVKIPLGTALGEELLFRGVALGVGMRRWSLVVAVAGSSALFGLWHVLPSIDSHSTNSVAMGVPVPLLVVATVGITAVAGVGFSWLRLWTGHVAAPLVVHAALNASALMAAAVVST